MSRRRRRWWKWGLLVGGGVTGAVLLTGWLMLQHVPSWYRPVAIAPADRQRIRDDLQGTENVLTESIRRKASFRHTFKQEQINTWLAVRESVWPQSRHWLPESLSEPFVAIDEEGIRLAATYRHGGGKTVLSARLGLHADRDAIHVQLLGLAAGEVGMPESWVRDWLTRLDHGPWPAGRKADYQYGGASLPALSGLLEGVGFPNAWLWWNGRQPFRITDVKLEPGALTVTFEPLGR